LVKYDNVQEKIKDSRSGMKDNKSNKGPKNKGLKHKILILVLKIKVYKMFFI
jgi:hypothetical protein